MLQHGTDANLICQVFKQVFYNITAQTLNNQLVRKELCNWSKAMQIRLVQRNLQVLCLFKLQKGCYLEELELGLRTGLSNQLALQKLQIPNGRKLFH